MTYFDYLNTIISEIVDDIENRIDELGLYKMGAMKFIKLEIAQRIKNNSKNRLT